jgi:hypothetical protein
MTVASWITQAPGIQQSVWAPIISSGVFGGVVAIGGVFVGAWVTDKNNRKSERRSRTDKTQILAASIAAEISGLLRRYETAIGNRLDKIDRPEDFLFGFVPPRFNFFVVFDANAAATGLLKPADARDIISFYVLMKGHFEDLITWVSEIRHNTSDSAQFALFELIKRDHNELVSLKTDLLARLDSYPSGDQQ